MALEPIGRTGTGLADEAYRRISEAMLRGEIPPGERLVMDTLAVHLDISRTPVRDALRRLEREGMVEATGRKGYMVRAVPPDDLAKFYDARLAVEVHAAVRVAELGEDAIAHVENAVHAAIELGAADPAKAYAANRLIHRGIVEATGNPILLDLFDDLWNMARAFLIFEQFHRLDEDEMANLKEHWEIVYALREGPQRADRVMREHIEKGLRAHRNNDRNNGGTP